MDLVVKELLPGSRIADSHRREVETTKGTEDARHAEMSLCQHRFAIGNHGRDKKVRIGLDPAQCDLTINHEEREDQEEDADRKRDREDAERQAEQKREAQIEPLDPSRASASRARCPARPAQGPEYAGRAPRAPLRARCCTWPRARARARRTRISVTRTENAITTPP